MDHETRYLLARSEYWHYQRRVPAAYQPYDSRKFIRSSLKTRSIILAKQRRDALEAANNNHWLNVITANADSTSNQKSLLATIKRQYELDRLRATTFEQSSGNSDVGIISTAFTDVLRQLGVHPPLTR